MKHIVIASAFALSQLAAVSAFAQTAGSTSASAPVNQKEASTPPKPQSTNSREGVKSERDGTSKMSVGERGDASSAPMAKSTKSRAAVKGERDASAKASDALHGKDNPPAR